MSYLILSIIQFVFFMAALQPMMSSTQAAPIPEGAVFWVSYDDDLPGDGDRMMAKKLSERIQKLGYTSIFFPLSHPPRDAISPPDVIIQVPDDKGGTPVKDRQVRRTVLQECGYPPEDGCESLGLRSRLQGDFLGLLLDEDLMRRYQADPLKSLEQRARAYSELSQGMRSRLDSLLGLSLDSSLPEIETQLATTDFYFGYSQVILSQQYLSEIAQGLSRRAERRPLVILTGGDFAGKLRERNQSLRAGQDRSFLLNQGAAERDQRLSFDSPPVAKKFCFHSSTASHLSDASLDSFLTHSFSSLSLAHKPQISALESERHSTRELTQSDFFSPYFLDATKDQLSVRDPALLLLPRVDHSDFKLLLYLSAVALVTGDRSTEEAISAGVPFLYEKLSHKSEFARQLDALSPSGFITVIPDVEQVREDLLTYAELDERHVLGWHIAQLRMISRAQDFARIPERESYYHFFRVLQDESYFNDQLLREFLERAFDQSPVRPYVPEEGLELGYQYFMSLSQVGDLRISTSTGQSEDPEVREKLGLTSHHRFEYKCVESDLYLVSLQVR